MIGMNNVCRKQATNKEVFTNIMLDYEISNRTVRQRQNVWESCACVGDNDNH